MMPEYIEVDQMWKCETCFHHRSGKCALGMFGCDHGESYRPAYSKLKKADVAPVARGRWVKRPGAKGQVYCSECGALEEITDSHFKSKYCPMCNARMDGE